jgi:hypothetical protein
MTIIYEVTLSVPQTITDEYLGWLRNHVSEILQLEGFMDAKIYQINPETFVVHYHVATYNALIKYFEQQAPALRQQGIDRFGDLVAISRRILQPC